jgi:hypothetical protein
MLPQLFACHVESCQKQDALGYNRFRSPNFLSIAPDTHTNHIICTTSTSAIRECVSYKETNELQGKKNNSVFLLFWPKHYTPQYLVHLTIQAYTCISNLSYSPLYRIWARRVPSITPRLLFIFNYALQPFKSYCVIWVRRSKFRHQASPRVSPRESTQRRKVELWARNVR